jgi:hypothetical protein
MDRPTPQIVRLKAELSGKDLGPRLEQLVSLAREAGMAAPVAFETPLGAKPTPIARLDPARIQRSQIELVLEDGSRLAISTNPGATGTLVQGSRAEDAGLSAEEVVRAQSEQTALLRALFATGDLLTGHVERVEVGLDALPSVALARRLPALVVTTAEVDRAYRDAAPFWAAWEEDLVDGDRHLLSRHLAAGSTPDWFRACFAEQWEMARAARPGDTFLGRKVAPPGCEELLAKGESRLRQVGYRDGHVELAGFVPKGEHVPPWEILTWSEALLRGSLEDGSPLSSVGVVFRDEAMARREATPLLDIGASVSFLARDGSYQPVE